MKIKDIKKEVLKKRENTFLKPKSPNTEIMNI